MRRALRSIVVVACLASSVAVAQPTSPGRGQTFQPGRGQTFQPGRGATLDPGTGAAQRRAPPPTTTAPADAAPQCIVLSDDTACLLVAPGVCRFIAADTCPVPE